MIFETHSVHRALSTLLAGVLLGTFVLVPLLDRNQAARTPALETEHHAATCVSGHDHTICTQVGANLWIAPADGSTLAHRPRLQMLTSAGTVDVASLRTHTSTWSRAPPAA